MSESPLTPADEGLIVAYVDDELSAEELAQFEARLAEEPELESAVHALLDADEFGLRLGQRGMLSQKAPPLGRRRIVPWVVGALGAAAALVIAVNWWSVAEPHAVVKVTDLAAGATRGGSDPSLKFRVHVMANEPCYMLVVTVCSPTSDGVDVVIRHPQQRDPFSPDNPNWPNDPFPIGQEVELPAPLKDGSSMVPFSIADRGLLLTCSKVDGPFDEAAIEQLIADLQSASAGLSASLRLAVGDADRAAHVRRVEEAARRGFPNWEVTSVALSLP